jgi:hypothetical protein
VTERDSSSEWDVHHTLNEPDPDPTEWSAPYDKRLAVSQLLAASRRATTAQARPSGSSAIIRGK